jgi:hypothetical protein
MALAGGHLFVANGGVGGGSLTEVNASTGALVRAISGPAYKFSDATAMALAGGHLFVANEYGGSLTEVRVSMKLG